MIYSLGYVTNWAGVNPVVVVATATTVQKCANAILARGPPDPVAEPGSIQATHRSPRSFTKGSRWCPERDGNASGYAPGP
jgi:hypothetical protein